MIRNLIGSRNGALVALSLAGVLTCASGCGETKTNTAANTPAAKNAEAKAPAVSPPAAPNTAAKPEGEHGHKPGSHGGFIVSIGADNFHAEAVFEKGSRFKLLMLGKDESQIVEVEKQSLTAYIKAEGDTEATEVPVEAAPQNGDSEGMTSQFAGTVPSELAGKPLIVTIPSIRIKGERFRIGFTTITEKHEAADGMPAKVSDEAERQLYLTPGGKYTQADIEANGNLTASQRFKGQMSAHNLKPQPGDKICPITTTKANPKFTWIVGGKSYEFCCPPCVDEFVKTAKLQPDEILAPEEYVKK